MFLIPSVKEDLFLGVLCEWDFKFSTLLIYLNYIKLKLIFVLNWDIIYVLILKF